MYCATLNQARGQGFLIVEWVTAAVAPLINIGQGWSNRRTVAKRGMKTTELLSRAAEILEKGRK